MSTCLRFLPKALSLIILAAPDPGLAAVGRIVTGNDSAQPSGLANVFKDGTQTPMFSLAPDLTANRGGVRVAVGDVNGDGIADLISERGPDGASIQVLSGKDQSELLALTPYGPEFSGGVFIASGDVNGDGLDDIVTGPGTGGGPHVRVFDGKSGAELAAFFPFSTAFRGGVRVATGDIDGDGFADIITASGPGGGTVRIYSGNDQQEIRAFSPFEPAFSGGIFVASGDINGDGVDDIVTGAGPGGGPHLKVFDGRTGRALASLAPYPTSFVGGIRVAIGDIDGDGTPDIVTGGGPGGAPVKVFSGKNQDEIRSFLGYDTAYAGGVFVASGDLNGDGIDDIVTGADDAGGPQVKVFDGRSGATVNVLSPIPMSFAGGVRVAAGDVDGDGAADLVVGSGPGDGRVKVLSGIDGALLRSFAPFEARFAGGVFVAAGDINGDGLDDVVTGAGPGGSPHVKVFDGRTGAELAALWLGPTAFAGGVRVATGDLDGDGLPDVVAGSGPGGGLVRVFSGKTRTEIRSFTPEDGQFSGGIFVAAGDINGDGVAEIVTGTDAGRSSQVRVFDGRSGRELQSFSPFPIGFTGGVRVAAADLDGDGRAEILIAPGAGLAARVRVFNGSTLNETGTVLAYPDSYTGGVFIGATSARRPVVETSFDAQTRTLVLRWPSGCDCRLEATADAAVPRAWQPLTINPVPNGNRLEAVIVPALGSQFFRLDCAE